ncbi:hypothetical protein B481_0129 [Planococcus halocryophilus Or1]|uniref:Uncharacterized protein n=1 Tax=Planococcus halocryophilus TaxID=1215089 RepID=A0A1C7DME9_9BACL|nr:hypothetical protein [Planococcus halocryophilus]ANU12548.1 hypothetical protein BBI08_01165 [Planococcus halocryophilus]EMF48294.1 hypothetical protein B481_0129 [Planococcus halocryophilus Or1]
MNEYEINQLIVEANQKVMQERLDAQQQTKNDLLEGTKQLAEQRVQDLADLKAKQDAHKEVAPVPEAEELKQLRAKAEAEDGQNELLALRKRFATKEGE